MEPGSIAVYSSAKTLTFRIAARILLGLRLEEKQFKDLAKTFEQLVENLFSLPLNIPFSGLRKVLRPALLPLPGGRGLGPGGTELLSPSPPRGASDGPGHLQHPVLGLRAWCHAHPSCIPFSLHFSLAPGWLPAPLGTGSSSLYSTGLLFSLTPCVASVGSG